MGRFVIYSVMNKLRSLVPWIFWIVVLLVVTYAGTRNNSTATGTANPRSYEQRELTGDSSDPCRSAVPARSVRTSSGLRGPARIEWPRGERHVKG